MSVGWQWNPVWRSLSAERCRRVSIGPVPAGSRIQQLERVPESGVVPQGVPISRFGELKPGDPVSVRASAPVGRVLEARVMSVSPMIDSASRSYRCLLELSNSDELLPSGFSVTLAARAPGVRIAGDIEEAPATHEAQR